MDLKQQWMLLVREGQGGGEVGMDMLELGLGCQGGVSTGICEYQE